MKYLLKKFKYIKRNKKNAEIIKYKRCTSEQKRLLKLFKDLLDTILSDKTLKLESQEDNTLMSSKMKIKMKMTKH